MLLSLPLEEARYALSHILCRHFNDDIVRGGNCRKKAALKNRSNALFINLDYDGWVRAHFLSASSFNRCYLVLQWSRVSCFWKMS